MLDISKYDNDRTLLDEEESSSTTTLEPAAVPWRHKSTKGGAGSELERNELFQRQRQATERCEANGARFSRQNVGSKVCFLVPAAPITQSTTVTDRPYSKTTVYYLKM